jgi:hypothetical protein
MQTNDLTGWTGSMPKVIDARTHAVLDYVTAGGFFALGLSLLNRNRRAAMLAFVNGGAVLGLSLMTDYPGGVFPTVSFKTHGAVDALQAAMTATGPALLGFAGEPEAQIFHAQAALETGIIAATDWESTRVSRLAA